MRVPGRRLLCAGFVTVAVVLSFPLVAAATTGPHVGAESSTGLQRQFAFESQSLSDSTQLLVNVANGNLVLAQHVLRLSGVAGHDLDISLYLESLNPNSWELGAYGGSLSVDSWLEFPGDGSVTLHEGAGGYAVGFASNGSGGYTHPSGVDATLVHNADGTYSLTWTSGEVQKFSSSGQLTSDTDRHGNAISFSYTSNGWISAITDTYGDTTTFTYGSGTCATRLTKITDPAGRTYLFGYSGDGSELTSYTNPDGKTTRFGWDGSGNLVSVTTAGGRTTTIAYDGSRRATSITRRDGDPATTYTYNSGNTVATDPDGNATTYTYDSSLRVTSVKDAEGNTQSATYTSDSNLSTFTDASNKSWSYGYDALDNLTSSKSPLEGDSNHPIFAYGAAGGSYQYDLVKYTDAEGSSWNYAYDNGAGSGPGDLTSVNPGGQQPVSFTYNSDGTVATATDGRGNKTTYTYTNHDLTTLTPPSPLGAVQVTYDSLHRTSTITDGNGQTRTFTYDGEDRIVEIAYSNGPTISYTYDADGNVVSETDPTGTYTYHYDALGRLCEEDAPSFELTYTYDPASNLTSVTDASGVTSYTYTQDNQVGSILEPGASNPIRFSYDSDGNRTEIDYPNGISQCLGYDDSRRLTSIVAQTATCGNQGTTLTSFTYGYSLNGLDTDRRQSVTSQYPGASPTTTYYCYSSLGQLTSADTSSNACPNSNAAYRYAYDADGNMTSKTANGTTTSYTYNAANELTNSGDTFDANGNMLTDSGVFTVGTYNQLDQMIKIRPKNSTTFNLAYQGVGQGLRTKAGSSLYVQGTLGIMSVTSGVGTTYYTHDADGTVIGLRDPANGSGDYYPLFDGLGSVVALTDSTGSVVDTFKYDPYGGDAGSTGSVVEPFRFAGGYYGSTMRMYLFGQRYYDPSTGRWTQPDPVDDPLALTGWNRYDYAGDDPINSIDPSGQSFCSVASWFSAAVALGCSHRVRHFAFHTAPRFVKRHWAEIVQAGAACYTVGKWGSVWGSYVAPEYGGTVVGGVAGCLVGAGGDLAGYDLEPPEWERK